MWTLETIILYLFVDGITFWPTKQKEIQSLCQLSFSVQKLSSWMKYIKTHETRAVSHSVTLLFKFLKYLKAKEEEL
jgi:hypothetical protein